MNGLEAIRKKSISYLSFRIGNEVFASHVSHVNNIVEVTKITKIPNAPDYMMGVINLRGQVLPVVDTRVRLGMNPTEVSTNTCILVLEVESGEGIQQIGGMVDSVKEVLELKEDDILPPPRIGKMTSQTFISGVAHRNDDFILIVDMNELFNGADLVDFAKEVKRVKEEIAVDE